MIINIITTFIATAVLWLTYRLLFRNCNRFQLNRFMLLSMTAFAFALPFIHITIPAQLPGNVAFTHNIPSYFMLQEVVVTAQNASTDSLNWINLVSVIYIIGVILFLSKLMFNILKIRKIARNNISETIDGINVVRTGEEHIPYSFMNNIFIPKGDTDPDILKHEMSHVRNRHSLDIIFIETATAFQWFNPFMRLIKKDLQNIHEYTADRDVIYNGADKTDYMMLILQQCTASGIGARPGASTSIGNNFSFSLTKKRIKMITQKKKTKGLIFRALLTAPVFALLLLANCIPNNNALNAQTRTYSFEGSKPDITFADPSKVNIVDTSGEQSSFDFSCVKNDTVMDFSFWPDDFWYIERKNSDSYNVSFTPKNDSIYRVVEQFPEYPGGTAKLLTFISENIKYPQSAMEKGIEGKCYIQFVIDVDGSITDVELMRGFDEECDAEALRVINLMPKWKPGKKDGKPVRVIYMIPVAFKRHN
ncbi:MAG: M56 family metallopeptidase [Bacteroidales bacterium]|nr:M56 family metallopeptidase [Bacteroidales bacterium]